VNKLLREKLMTKGEETLKRDLELTFQSHHLAFVPFH
jgi:hypothetical protein